MSLITVANLSHSYGDRKVLQDLNLSLGQGEVFALIGPTGAGKTTLLRIIDLLELPSSGEIYFDGKCVPRSGRQRLEIRRQMALVHQKPQLFNSTVYDNIACGLRWRGEKEKKIAEKVHPVLTIVGLEGYENRNARTLSGGEAQRVALARSLVLEPAVLLLDEPTANLDPGSAAKIEELISYVAKQRKTTMIIATHDMSQGRQLADRIGVLLDGKLVQTGSAKDVFYSPQNEDVARFVGMENVLKGVVSASKDGIATVSIGNSEIQGVSNYPVGKEVYACVRPEDITLTVVDDHEQTAVRSSARNSFQGKVTRVVPLGPLVRVEIDCGFRLVALVTKISAEELNLREGKQICATFKATGVHVMARRANQ